ncbi:MAG: phosphoribosyltransferase [Aigarchaeota archaeon]|nr:phosphoribosyltransferase [Aigarchaeota archaeon]MCX8193319.1 phosphoribosyltransferase [Nitrososphaeria archaeon]MDW7986538.1 phosphoribosyltransferase [Nitrososphaerota archaeon]
MDTYRVGDLKYLKVSWNRVEELVEELSKKISKDYEFDILIGILRGGVVVAHLLSDIMGIDEIYPIGCTSYVDIYKRSHLRMYHPLIINTLNNRRVLIVDDVADSGGTLKNVIEEVIVPKNPEEYRTATLHIKPWSTFKPDYYVEVVDAWIIYPWEKYEMIKLLAPRFIKTFGEEKAITELAELVDKDRNKVREILLGATSYSKLSTP